MKLSCPDNADHDRFETVCHVMQACAYDKDGEFIEVLDPDVCMSFGPDFHGNSVTCVECGADAVVED